MTAQLSLSAASDETGPTEAGGFNLRAVVARTGRRGGDEGDLLTETLRSQHLPEKLISRLVSLAGAPNHMPRLVDRLAVALGAHFHFLPIEEALRGPLLLLGHPGAGKTTLAAKLAARFDERQVLVISTDTQRPGGVTQLEEYLNVLGLPLAVAEDAAALRKAIAGADGRMVIIDTAGAAPDDPAVAAWLNGPAGTRAEPILVLPADSAAEEAAIAGSAAATIGTRRLMATRLDLARRIGAVLAAADAGKLALIATSVTPHFAFGLRALTPEGLARRLMTGSARPEQWRIGPL